VENPRVTKVPIKWTDDQEQPVDETDEQQPCTKELAERMSSDNSQEIAGVCQEMNDDDQCLD